MKNPSKINEYHWIFQRCKLWRDDFVGGIFYEDGFFFVEDAGGEVGGEGVDDGEG